MADPTLQHNVQQIWTNHRGVRTQFAYESPFTAQKEGGPLNADIPAAGKKVLWDPTTAAEQQVKAFKYFSVEADGDFEISWTCDKGGANEKISPPVKIPKGFLFVLPSNVTRVNFAGDPFAGVADVIDYVQVYNPGAASIRMQWLIVDDSVSV